MADTRSAQGSRERSELWVSTGACSELQYYFVRGMPIVVTVKGKYGHESWEIANGKIGKAHSFIHKESDNFEIPNEAFLSSSSGKYLIFRNHYSST